MNLRTLSQISYSLKLPREWLRNATDNGLIPCLRVGDRYLFDEHAVTDALAQIAAESRLGEQEVTTP